MFFGVQGLCYTTLGPRFARQCPGATLGCCGLGGVKLSGLACASPASPRPGVAPPHHAPLFPSPALPAPPLKPGAAAAQAAANWRQANALGWSRRSQRQPSPNLRLQTVLPAPRILQQELQSWLGACRRLWPPHTIQHRPSPELVGFQLMNLGEDKLSRQMNVQGPEEDNSAVAPIFGETGEFELAGRCGRYLLGWERLHFSASVTSASQP